MKKKLTYHDRPVKMKVESYRNNGTLAVVLVYRNGESDVITVNLTAGISQKVWHSWIRTLP